MSTDGHAAHASTHDQGHDSHNAGPSHGTLRSYLIGFALSVVLTAVPFWLVMARPIASNEVTAVAIMAFAIVQIVVHMIYFLHMDFRSEGGWTMMALVFTLIIVFIALSGSLWVMYHLDTNMMPGHATGQAP
ncbi:MULTISPECIES: cytochrome o ubiquinol oxidase subunit IV [unclassified Chelatococcus]|uniref:cytochrome o ubiquinol oxidase subunit IV n=1 Tax=unclassified Chelatococcus TaxID=2638111 RepID=UPI001BCEBFA0|nr:MULTISPECIES: cytochrome o ubiquinol oxidase subunit IV [unclassified Chelatococcus]MBS7701163.1 cytochrome o ubiquinol oxidase subunit IV [Chelatococcus sp. YT9]MBX3557294.1 cytochrome o ubiquinol oxidase subunit IV [Chelatococcus sp.]